MAKEIERKFLVDKKLWQYVTCHIHTSEKLVQGYLSKKPTTVRVRTSSNKYAVLTIKGKTEGFTCDEFEYPIPVDEARELLEICSEVIVKTRHWIQVGEHLWSVDDFQDRNRGLLLAEIELKSEDEEILMPAWVRKEVTYDKRYKNTYLATHKVPTK